MSHLSQASRNKLQKKTGPTKRSSAATDHSGSSPAAPRRKTLAPPPGSEAARTRARQRKRDQIQRKASLQATGKDAETAGLLSRSKHDHEERWSEVARKFDKDDDEIPPVGAAKGGGDAQKSTDGSVGGSKGIKQLRLPPLRPKELNDLRERFDDADNDNSGALDYSEVKELMRHATEASGNEMTSQDITDIIHLVDVNGDGEIDFHEFCYCMQVGHGEPDIHTVCQPL